MSINNEKRMLVVIVSIAASECFALFFCLSRINNQKNAVADDSYTALSKSPKKKKKKSSRAADSTKRKAHARRRDEETTR